jgi:hypothetical protein
MGKMVSGSQMKSFCVTLGLYNWFKSQTGSGPHQAAFDEMQSGELNFIIDHPQNVIGLLDAIINGTPDNEVFWDNLPTYNAELNILELVNTEINVKTALLDLKVACLNHSNPEEEPQPEPAPLVYTTQTTEWIQGKDIIIDLEQPLAEPKSATLWLKNSGMNDPEFDDENMGRPCRLLEAKKYLIRMEGKRGSGTVEVRIPVENALFNIAVI